MMDKLEIFIVMALVPFQTEYHAITINQIKKVLDERQKEYKRDNIYRKAQALLKDGYVSFGIKSGKANTYYLTPKGRKMFEDNIKNKGDI